MRLVGSQGLGFKIVFWVQGLGFNSGVGPMVHAPHPRPSNVVLFGSLNRTPNQKTIPNPKKELHWRVQVNHRVEFRV